jgi:exodeoxyribonuclease-3
MKIATFNINNVNRRLPNLLDWLKVRRPDVVCLQELKATDRQFPRTAIADAGYGAAFVGQSAWNGVAILARGADPVVTQTALPGDPDDDQARYIEAAVNGVVIGCLYAPNGNPQPGPKFQYKLRWMERLHEHAAELLATKLPVVLAGDYNIVPEPRDIYATTSYRDNALVQPAARAAYAALLEQGAERRTQARPLPAQQESGAKAQGRRGRSRGERPGRRQRSRSGVDRTQRLAARAARD